MRPSLDFYMARLDAWPFEVGVDLSLIDGKNHRGLSYRWHVRFELNHPTDDGLCGDAEEALLLAIQEEMQQALEPGKAVLAAVVTHRSARTFVLYVDAAPSEDHPILAAMAKVQTHHMRVMHEVDVDWNEYKDVLYPAQPFLHQIRDRRILREFERSGDDCSEVHAIEPRFVGLTKEGAASLSKLLADSGFGVKAIDEVGLNSQREWQVTGMAKSPLALSILDDFRQVWLDLAERAGGRYDGWSAEVVPVTGANNNHGCDGHLSGVAEDYEDGDDKNR